MLPKLSTERIISRIDKIGFGFYPDLRLVRARCEKVLEALYDAYPELFYSLTETSPGVFAFSRNDPSLPVPEHTLVLTPKGGTLTFVRPEFRRDDLMTEVALKVVGLMRELFPLKRVPRFGRIIELIHDWEPDHPNPHDWLRENFTVFDPSADDVHEVNFRLLYRTKGMNINTFLTPVRERNTGRWGLQVVCDTNNIDTSGDVSAELARSIVDFSTLYFPDRTFEFLNAHVEG